MLLLTILEHRYPGPFAQYLNFLKLSLIISWKDIKNLKDLEGNKHFQRIEKFYHIKLSSFDLSISQLHIRMFSLLQSDVGIEITM